MDSIQPLPPMIKVGVIFQDIKLSHEGRNRGFLEYTLSKVRHLDHQKDDQREKELLKYPPRLLSDQKLAKESL